MAVTAIHTGTWLGPNITQKYAANHVRPTKNKPPVNTQWVATSKESPDTSQPDKAGATIGNNKHHTSNSENVIPTSRPPPPITRIVDTGTSQHNWAYGDGMIQEYQPYTKKPPTIMIPNGDNIPVLTKYNLNLPNVSAPRPPMLTLYPHFNVPYYPWDSSVMTGALPCSQKRIAPFVTIMMKSSLLAAATNTLDYLNNTKQSNNITAI